MSFIATQNMNQLVPTPMLGSLSGLANPNITSAKVVSTSTAVITAGTSVKLVAGTSNQILVDAVSGPTDGPVYGAVVYNSRGNVYGANSVLTIARSTSEVFMEASGAIARGDTVASKPGVANTSDPQVTTDTTSGHYITGIALDTATAEGQLIRVLIQPSKNP